MMTTINISLPTSMYKDTKRLLSRRGYASISEAVRDALRPVLYPRLTENGFTPEFEDAVLKSAAQPRANNYILETDKDIEDYFLHLKLPKKKSKRK